MIPVLLALQALGTADSLLALGDTNGALAVYERLVRADRRNAEAHWRAGELYMTRHVPGSQNSPDRRRAEEHFRYATRFAADSAKYWLSLAALFRGEDWTLARMQVEGILDDARAAAMRAADTVRLAEAEYRAGRVAFERWERYRDRWPPGLRPELPDSTQPDGWEHERRRWVAIRQQTPESGLGDARAAEERFRRSLALDPRQVRAAGLLAILLGERTTWTEALEVARATLEAAPDSASAWALIGLVHARLERWREAEAAYDSAFARMSPEERAPYDDIGLLLRTRERQQWEALAPAERAAVRAGFWLLTQPLLLTGQNEPRTEYDARVTQARVRWSEPELGRDGARSDRGQVYLRYGAPDLVGTDVGGTVTWVYWPARLAFQFGIQSGYANARLGDGHWALDQLANVSRGRFDNLTLVRTMDTIAVQTVQFRRQGSDSASVVLFAWVPLARMTGGADLHSLALSTAAIVLADHGEVMRLRRDEVVEPRRAGTGQHRTWHLTLAPATYVLRAEAHAPVLGRGARHSEALTVRAFNRPDFTLSDLLVARRLTPRNDAPARWTDFLIEPSAGRAEPGEVVSLLWENYNLTPDSAGIARWRVELRVTVSQVERRSWLGRIVGGVGDAIGASALGDERISLGWDRDEAVPAGGTVVDWVTLDFGDAPPGSYAIDLLVTDRVGGTTIERTRTIVRSEREAER